MATWLLALAQVMACAAILTGVAIAFGVRWHTSLVAGLGLALSSTAMALQAIGELNLLFQDVAAIPILALLPLLGLMAGNNEAAIHGRTGAVSY